MRILIDCRLATHWKTRRLALVLGQRNVLDYLIRLWVWAFENAAHGRLAEFTPTELAAIMEWEGHPRTLISALLKTGFLDANPLRIHDWADWNGAYRRRYDRARARNQRWRDRIKRERETKENSNLHAADASRDASRARFGRISSGEVRPGPARPGPISPPPTSSSPAGRPGPEGGGGRRLSDPAWARVWDALPKRRAYWEERARARFESVLADDAAAAACATWIERRRQTQGWIESPPTPLAVADDYRDHLEREARAAARLAAKQAPREKSKAPPPATVHAPQVWPGTEQLERDGVTARKGRTVRT